jgi:hypothetical protein
MHNEGRWVREVYWLPYLARPAGFEPATGGLEVPGDAFATVRRRSENRLDKADVD